MSSDAPTYWDDLEAYSLIGAAQRDAANKAATDVTRLLHDMLRKQDSIGLAVIPYRASPETEAELLRAVDHAIAKTRMLQSFYEVLRLRLLRKLYADGTQGEQQEIPSRS